MYRELTKLCHALISHWHNVCIALTTDWHNNEHWQTSQLTLKLTKIGNCQNHLVEEDRNLSKWVDLPKPVRSGHQGTVDCLVSSVSLLSTIAHFLQGKAGHDHPTQNFHINKRWLLWEMFLANKSFPPCNRLLWRSNRGWFSEHMGRTSCWTLSRRRGLWQAWQSDL